MRQQINLYQPIFSEERKLFGARTVGAGFAILLAALGAFSIYANVRISALDKNVATLRAQQAQQQSMLESTGQMQTARSKPGGIQTHIAQLSAAIAERDRALQILQGGAAGQTTGFAPRLEALARRHVEGLWIDSVLLSGTDGSMSLSGATLNPDIIPAYLDSLARDAVLTGTRFDEFVIERPTARSATAVAGDAAEDGEEKAARPHVAGEVRFRAGSSTLNGASAEAAT
jgi:hypothetical protein